MESSNYLWDIDPKVDYLKYGLSDNWKSRESSYVSISPNGKLLYKIDFDTSIEGDNAEKDFHTTFEKYRYPSDRSRECYYKKYLNEYIEYMKHLENTKEKRLEEYKRKAKKEMSTVFGDDIVLNELAPLDQILEKFNIMRQSQFHDWKKGSYDSIPIWKTITLNHGYGKFKKGTYSVSRDTLEFVRAIQNNTKLNMKEETNTLENFFIDNH